MTVGESVVEENSLMFYLKVLLNNSIKRSVINQERVRTCHKYNPVMNKNQIYTRIASICNLGSI